MLERIDQRDSAPRPVVAAGEHASVPTDCPQRAEREGWMGDIQAFSQTAIFQRDMSAFFTKWVPDIRDSQCGDGRFSDVSPHVSEPEWGFSGCRLGRCRRHHSLRVYQNYADTRMLEEHLAAAKRWSILSTRATPICCGRKIAATTTAIGSTAVGLRATDAKPTFVCQNIPRLGEMPHDVFSTAFFAHSSEIVAKMAKVLKRTDDAAKYSKLFEEIKAAFNKAFVSRDGRIKGDNQAGYALALHFNLFDEALQPKATEHLVEGIRKFKNHPSTGIQSSHRMMLELSRNGRHDEAWRLINLRTVPSWGYMVESAQQPSGSAGMNM